MRGLSAGGGGGSAGTEIAGLTAAEASGRGGGAGASRLEARLGPGVHSETGLEESRASACLRGSWRPAVPAPAPAVAELHLGVCHGVPEPGDREPRGNAECIHSMRPHRT